MSQPEISDEELERRMRRKLFFDGPSSRRSTLSDEERRVAEKLLGRDNAERLTNLPSDRRFKPKPVFVHYEYYWVDGSAYSMGGWRINLVENGRVTEHDWDSYGGDLNAEIARLRRQNFTVKHLVTEAERERDRLERVRAAPQCEKPTKKAILDSLKDFHP